MVHWLASLGVFALLATSSLGTSFRADQLSTIDNHEALSNPVLSEPASFQPQAAGTTLEMVGQIGGSITAIAVDGDFMYAGIGPRLVVLDVADSAHPSSVGQTEVFPNTVESVLAAGRYVYIAAGSYGLRVIDVIQPTAPVEVGFFLESDGWVRDVAMVDHTLYAITNRGLSIFDVTNPVAPIEIGSCAIPGPDGGASVTVVDDIAYVASYRGGLQMIDVTDPAAPVEIGVYQGYAWIADVAVIGSHAYIATAYDHKLVVLDVANPAVPVEVGSYTTYYDVWHVAAAGGYAYVTETYRFSVIDVANPAMLVNVGIFEMFDPVTDVAIAGGFAYIASSKGELRTLQVPDPTMAPAVGYSTTSGAVRGVAVAGTYAYVATGSRLQVFDVTNPIVPVENGYCETPGEALAVALVGPMAYVADNNHGLRVIDVSDPAAPFELGYFDTPLITRDVAVSGSYAYLADGAGLRIIDVDDPKLPTQIAYYAAGPMPITSVAVVDNYVYMVSGTGITEYNGLEIVDVSNPAAPVRAGFYALFHDNSGVAVAEGYAYVASSGGMHVIDVANPALMAQVGFINTYGSLAVTTAGSYAFLTTYEGLEVIDISDPSAPAWAASYKPSVARGKDLVVDGGYAYVAAGNDLQVFDMRVLASLPVEVGHFVAPGGFASHVALAGRWAYTIDYRDGLRVIDLTRPAALTEVGAHEVGALTDPWTLDDVEAADDYVYLAASNLGLQIVDATNPAAPVEVGRCLPDSNPFSTAVVGDYAYVVDGYGLHTIDATDRQNPVEVGSVFLPWGGDDWLSRTIAVAGGYAYVAQAANHWRVGLSGGLWIVDITNPTAPVEVGSYNLRTAAWGVAVAGDYAYVVYQSGLRIIDISVPSAPVSAGDFAVSGARSVAVEELHAYITTGGGVRMIGVRNPAAMIEIDYYALPGWATDVAVADGYVYVADGSGGLYALRRDEPSDPWRIWLPVLLRP